MLPNTHALKKGRHAALRCAALCKRKPTTIADIRIDAGEWKEVAFCTQHWNEIRRSMKYKQFDGINVRGYTESKWGEVSQIVEYGSSHPIVD